MHDSLMKAIERRFPSGGARAIARCLLVCCVGIVAAMPALAQEEPRFSIRRFVVDGQNPLSEAETEAVLAGYTGEQIGVARLKAAARHLESELKARGYGFYRVTLPPQDVTDTVSLKLVMFRVGKVDIQENQHYDSDNIRAAFPTIRPGESPNAREVARNLAMFNDHPGKKAVVTLAESETRDAIDVQLKVKDANPLTLFSALQNNGSRQTGMWRLTLGVQHANLFDADQQLTATYTTSPDRHIQDVNQYGLNWVAPLYGLASTLSAYAVYSDVNSGRVAGAFDVSGRGTFGGVRWAYHLLPVGDINQQLALGLDIKQYTNNVLFNGANQGSDVGALPMTLSYSGEWRQGWGSLEWNADYASNLPGGTDNDDLHYAANRAGATRRWDLFRSGVSLAWQAENGWSVNSRLRAQYSGKALIPGEQFGLGGAQSVRGYDEREISGDMGHSASVELWTPVIAGQLRFLTFADAGQVRYSIPSAGVPISRGIASVGVGTRWQIFKDIGFSLDVGHALRDAVMHEAGDWRAHALLTARF